MFSVTLPKQYCGKFRLQATKHRIQGDFFFKKKHVYGSNEQELGFRQENLGIERETRDKSSIHEPGMVKSIFLPFASLTPGWKIVDV